MPLRPVIFSTMASESVCASECSVPPVYLTESNVTLPTRRELPDAIQRILDRFIQRRDARPLEDRIRNHRAVSCDDDFDFHSCGVLRHFFRVNPRLIVISLYDLRVIGIRLAARAWRFDRRASRQILVYPLGRSVDPGQNLLRSSAPRL